jgi:hypothetical protein
MDQQKAQHGLKRAREAAGGAPSHHHHPLATLLEQIRRLKLPSVDPDTANRLLGPFIREALRLDERGTLLAIVQQFGWQAGGEFTQAIDLGSFSLLLQVRGCCQQAGRVCAAWGRALLPGANACPRQ